MELVTYGRYLRTSSRKLLPLANLIRGKSVAEAELRLKLSEKKAGGVLLKILHSAVANAENNHQLSRQGLFVDTISVGEAPRFKRFRPASRGKALGYHKANAHVRLTLKERVPVAGSALTAELSSAKKNPSGVKVRAQKVKSMMGSKK